MDLTEWMAANGYRDARLAEELGIVRAHLTNIRLGRRRPSFAVARRLATKTGLPIETFWVDQ